MGTPTTRLELAPQRTALMVEPAAGLVVEIGYRNVRERFFRHDPPTPGELESAIDAIEDALMASPAQRSNGGTLVIGDEVRQRLPGLLPEGTATTLEDIEARFQRLASASLGHPGALATMPIGPEAAAALVILRECMHHLGYARLLIPQTSTDAR
jgi:exopolyphosphatase/pppGpp-phosphohydrolase